MLYKFGAEFHALYAPFHLINIELVPILMGH